MLDRYNKRRNAARERGHRSQLETDVENSLVAHGFTPEYEVERFSYVLHRKYAPDFRVGGVYVEVKGWWPSNERSKFLAVILNNPTIPIFVALQKPHQKISRTSKTSYAQWCDKHGIAWCPIPIPPDFVERWIKGERLTFHAPAPTAPAVTPPRRTQMDPFTASPVEAGSTRTEHDGANQ